MANTDHVTDLTCRNCTLTLADHVLANEALDGGWIEAAFTAFERPFTYCLEGLGHPTPALTLVNPG